MKLTPKQKAFADYYIESLNASEAYSKAGYDVKSEATLYSNASRLLRNAKVKSYIEQIMSEKDNERILSQNEVLEFLSDVVKGKITEQVPLVLGKEFTVIDKEPSIKDRTKAAELIGKRYAIFTDNIQANVSNDITVTWGDDDGAND